MTSTTVFNAISENNMDLFNLCDKNIIIRKDEIRRISPLFYACMNNKLDFVKRIVEIKKEIEQKTIVSVDDCDYENYSCLMISEDINIIKYLVSEGANINHKDNCNNNALLLWNSIEITNFWLENGVDINSTNIYDDNALDMAYSCKNIQYFLFLIKKGIIITQDNINGFEGIYKTIIDNPFYYYMRENIKDYFLDMNILNFLYEILGNDIGSIIYSNPLKIYNGKFNIGKDDIRYFLNKIKSYKGIQSQKYKEIFISLI